MSEHLTLEDMKQDLNDYLMQAYGTTLPYHISELDVRLLWDAANAMHDPEAPIWFKGYATAMFSGLRSSADKHASQIAELKQALAEARAERDGIVDYNSSI